MSYRILISLAIIALLSLHCNLKKEVPFLQKTIYKTDQLVITQIAPNSYIHTSFLRTQSFGYVPCNGLFVTTNSETIVFDTPTNDTASIQLIEYVTKTLHRKIAAVLPTHFHDDCLGGLRAFHNNNIPSYANTRTIDSAIRNKYVVPQNKFTDSMQLPLGNTFVTAKFFGEGHTSDNVVCFFPKDNILFGGCLIKELNASKGYLGDANVAAWSSTVENVKAAYSNIKYVVPGHGSHGNSKLLDYTIKLFKP